MVLVRIVVRSDGDSSDSPETREMRAEICSCCYIPALAGSLYSLSQSVSLTISQYLNNKHIKHNTRGSALEKTEATHVNFILSVAVIRSDLINITDIAVTAQRGLKVRRRKTRQQSQ